MTSIKFFAILGVHTYFDFFFGTGGGEGWWRTLDYDEKRSLREE